MGKVVFWIVVIFAVLLCLRLYNLAQQKRRSAKNDAKPSSKAPDPPEAMVRCARCGVYLPRSEARLIAGAIRCREKDCA